MFNYKPGEYVWTSYYFNIYDDIYVNYRGKPLVFSNRIENMHLYLNRSAYVLSNTDNSFESQICNFGDPVY